MIALGLHSAGLGQSRTAPTDAPMRDAATRHNLPLTSLCLPPLSGGPGRALVVLCHGIGADAGQVFDLAPAWAQAVPEASFVAPHAPFPHHHRSRWLSFLPAGLAAGLPSGLARRPIPLGREWFSLTDRSPAAIEAGVRAAAAALDDFIDAELRWLALPPEALVLVGFSQGATTALFTGLRRQVPPRGILGFSGALPVLPRLAREIRNRAPVLLVHGEADTVVPIARARETELALRALDVPVDMIGLPGIGHAIDPIGMRAGADFLGRVLA